jgi:hypothetical protein
VLAAVTVYPSSTVSEDAAVKVLVEGLQHLIAQAPILVLELRLPLELEVVPRVVDDLVEGRGFGGTFEAFRLSLLAFVSQVPVSIRLFLEIYRWPRGLSSLLRASTRRYYFTVLNVDRNIASNAMLL